MVATYTALGIGSRIAINMAEYDPDDTTANIVTLGPGAVGSSATDKCLPIALFKRFLVRLHRSVGTGSVGSFSIIAATDAAGTGSTAVVTHAIGSAPNAVNDQISLECDVEQIHEVLSTATHVGVTCALVTATDECVFGVVRCDPTFAYAGLTADYIS